jgi:3-dehydroquinate dehydratase/shikimate dehydrogenase
MICIPIVSKTTKDVIKDMAKAEKFADLIEIRADYINDLDLEKILAAKNKPVIVTITPENENGRFKGTEKERTDLLKQAVDLGADYIDISIECPESSDLIKYCKSTKSIVSYHNYDETPSNLFETAQKIEAAGADIIKIATCANKLSDNLKIFELIRKSTKDIIAICMGEQGEISRILGPVYGSYLTFGSLESGKESAPGQIPARILRDVYRINEVEQGFDVYGLIGNPVNKSRGYQLFNPLFKHYNINAMYLNFLVEDIDDFTRYFQGLLTGFSITMPFKQELFHILNDITPEAEKIGAINTIVKDRGKIIGHNTDIAGIINPLLEKVPLKGKAVTLLGAGGAARAAAVGIMAKGGKLTILNRTISKAKKLAKDLGCNFGPVSDFKNIKTDILINMTSVGMEPDIEQTPVDTMLIKDMVVFDGIYNPEKTKLLIEAEKNGCTIIPGTEMFIHQAAEQFKLWTGINPDLDVMKNILK